MEAAFSTIRGDVMRILVTGALGHIGSRLIRALPARFPGAEIVMVDNLSTQRYCSLFDLPHNALYRFHEADILTADLTKLVSGASAVIHLAALTNAAASFDIQKEVEQVNFHGTQRIADACLGANASLLFPSTTSVYGTQAVTVDEDCAPTDLKPQSPYAESKLKAEEYLHTLQETKGLRFIACRFGTIFGTSQGMRFHTAINKFCWQAVNGMPLTVWKTAMDQRRPYLDLGDAVNSIAFIIENQLFSGGLYNVLTINSSVREIIDTIRLHIPNVEVEYVETKIMNQLSYTVLGEKFKKTGFRYAGNMEQGISDTLRVLDGIRQR
jgi:UDP-glucose 4-epimerase